MLALEPPPTQTVRPFGARARPSHPSATGVRDNSVPLLVSTTLSEGGLYPPFSTIRKRPSAVNTEDIGMVSKGS